MSISQPSKKRKAEAISSKTDAAPSAVAFTSAAAAASRLLRFSGHAFLRHRLVLSILSGRPIRIDKIRSQSTEPGLNTSEASFLRLLEKITNGSKVEIGYTGTSLFLKPGVISGGKITHDCGLEKGIGWFLEWIAVLAPFAKKELHLTLRGITTHHDDLGVRACLLFVDWPLTSSTYFVLLHRTGRFAPYRDATASPAVPANRTFFARLSSRATNRQARLSTAGWWRSLLLLSPFAFLR